MSIEKRVQENSETAKNSERFLNTSKAIENEVEKLQFDLVSMISPDEKTIKSQDDFDETEQEKFTKMANRVAELRKYQSLIPAMKTNITETDGVDPNEFNKAVRDEAMKNLRDNQLAPQAKDLNVGQHIANLLDYNGAIKRTSGLKSVRDDVFVDTFKPSSFLGIGQKQTVLEVNFNWGEESAAQKLLGETNPSHQNLKSIYTGGIGNPVQTVPATNGYGGFICGLEIDPMVCIRKSPIMEDCFNHKPATGSRILFTREAFESNQMDFVAETIYATEAPLPVQPARIGRKPEVHMGFEDVSVRMAKLAGFQRISEETFEDCPTIANAVISVMERFYNEKKAEAILQADGVFPNPLGAYNQPGILTSIFQDAGSRGTPDDTRQDFLRRIRTDLRINGCSEAQLRAVIHPYDLEEMDLEKDADGKYLLEMNGDCVTREVWCVQFCENTFAVENQMLVGDLPRAVNVHERQSMRVWIGYVGESAIENALYIIVEGRFAVSVCDLWCLLRATGM